MQDEKPGETIYKGHRSYDLMLNLQLGIRWSVGKFTQLADPGPLTEEHFQLKASPYAISRTLQTVLLPFSLANTDHIWRNSQTCMLWSTSCDDASSSTTSLMKRIERWSA
jgi:hypothetical protein